MRLVCELVDDAAVLATACNLAEAIARNAPLSVMHTKRLLHATDETGLGDGLRLERDALVEILHSDDRAEGMRAFKEKRDPVWRGR